MLGQLLGQIDHLDGMAEQFDARIEAVMSPLEKRAVERLDEMPGIDTRSGQIIVAEVGAGAAVARQFPSGHHLASWAGVCPGNHESAGKRRGGRTRPGNGWLKAALMQAAWAASRTRRSHYCARHRRLAARRGAKRATMAVAHGLIKAAAEVVRTTRRVVVRLAAQWPHWDLYRAVAARASTAPVMTAAAGVT